MGDDRVSNSPWLDRLLDTLGSGLLLFFTLGGFLISFLSIYTVDGGVLALFYTDYGTARLLGTAAAMSLAALAVWSLPRFRLPAAALLAVGWAGLVWYFAERFSNGALLTVQAVANLFADRVGWSGPLKFDLGLSLQEGAQAVEAFILLILTMLALILGWVIIRVRRWWLVVMLTLPPLLPGLMSDVYPNWPAFLALAACWCTMLLGDLCRSAKPAPRGKLTLLLLAALGGVLAVTFLLSPQEGWQRPQWARTAEEKLTDFGDKHLSFLYEIKGPFHNNNRNTVTFVGSADTVDLRKAGPLRYTGRTVLKITGDYTGKVYLRGSSLSKYNDGVWTPMDTGVYAAYEERVEEEDLYDGSPLLFGALSSADGGLYTVTVENTGASGSCVYAPYQLTDQDWSAAGLLPVEDSYLAHARGMWSHTIAFTPLPKVPEWLASKPAVVTRAEGIYQSLVIPHYQNIPEELARFFRENCRDLERYTEPYTTENGRRLAYARGISAMLAERCAYDPSVPVTPEEEDPVVWFFSESHRGYCMHFASTATLLLRYMGIPARYVSGFTAELETGETIEVPDNAAHAWVEVYLDGYGWYPVEVTPDYVPPEPEVTDDPRVTPSAAPSERPSAEPNEPEHPDDDPAGTQGISGEDGVSSVDLSRILPILVEILKWLAIGAAVLAAVWLGQAVPKRIRGARLNAPDTGRAVLDSYRYLSRLEKWGGSMPEAVLELARKARFSQHTMTEEERGMVIQMLDMQRLQIGENLRQPKKLLFRYWWGWPKLSENAETGEGSSHDDP